LTKRVGGTDILYYRQPISVPAVWARNISITGGLISYENGHK
jgi:hypothetical protein